MLKDSTNPSRPGLKKAIVWAAMLFFVDAILLNQGVISAIIGFFVIIVYVPKALFARDHRLRTYKLKTSAIWLVAVVSVFAFNRASNEMAHQRANNVISAVKAYHQEHRAYPKRLDDLVPDYLTSIPRAKYVLGLGEFKYLYDAVLPALIYVEYPPFGRTTYRFERGEWGYVD